MTQAEYQAIVEQYEKTISDLDKRIAELKANQTYNQKRLDNLGIMRGNALHQLCGLIRSYNK